MTITPGVEVGVGVGDEVAVRTTVGGIVRGTLVWFGDRTVELAVRTAAGRSSSTTLVIPRESIADLRPLSSVADHI